MESKVTSDIRVLTLGMKPPVKLAEKTTLRQAFSQDIEADILISHEAFLRRTAYAHSIIKTDDSFYDDSDMQSDYYLVVVYDKASNTPLLSTRYYFDKSIITKYLRGDNNSELDFSYLGSPLSLDSYSHGTIFLADRLSGNLNHPLYSQFRTQIFSLFHNEIAQNNKTRSLLLMVRDEKQLSKYLHMGFACIGSTLHKGQMHNIVIRKL